MSSALQWFKSTYSSDAGGECVEVGYDWHKSSHTLPAPSWAAFLGWAK
ncbi:DUF397 domain-containing protein [Streptomyces sp. TRM66268-LWL]|uniref:DUF397 domain-containing protein n=1 Tax=Streptomyces polyasparticus TaxID=2767826 RepID=A0ABR7SGE5_9ACTN|nr:DUF397 domain-containing protein [Streptomyces polyasparticus]